MNETKSIFPPWLLSNSTYERKYCYLKSDLAGIQLWVPIYKELILPRMKWILSFDDDYSSNYTTVQFFTFEKVSLQAQNLGVAV